MGLNRRWKHQTTWMFSALAGAAQGCFFRWLLSNSSRPGDSQVMTIGFLAILPLCMGYIAVDTYLRRTPAEDVDWQRWVFLPLASVLLAMAVALIVGWEGAICVFFAAPIMLVFSTIGGLIARAVWVSIRKRTQGTFSAFALPLLVILAEAHISPVRQIRTVQTEIMIHAPASIVWDNIKSVRAIDPSELPGAWVTRIGFPKPVVATLSHEGVGGVRDAAFTGGLVFTETVNRWEPGSDLRFSIRANTDSIPPSTLDEHVTIGGAFFDVLEGEYRLEPRPDGVLLHLASQERLSTHFNPYAGIWTDAVMRSIQKQILEVIRARCERGVKVDAPS